MCPIPIHKWDEQYLGVPLVLKGLPDSNKSPICRPQQPLDQCYAEDALVLNIMGTICFARVVYPCILWSGISVTGCQDTGGCWALSRKCSHLSVVLIPLLNVSIPAAAGGSTWPNTHLFGHWLNLSNLQLINIANSAEISYYFLFRSNVLRL